MKEKFALKLTQYQQRPTVQTCFKNEMLKQQKEEKETFLKS